MTVAGCQHCRHYYVTWDKVQPHGCRAFRFKSREIPGSVVERNSSGKPCQLFAGKDKQPPLVDRQLQ
jgi:hypothetical protein